MGRACVYARLFVLGWVCGVRFVLARVVRRLASLGNCAFDPFHARRTCAGASMQLHAARRAVRRESCALRALSRTARRLSVCAVAVRGREGSGE